MTKLEFAAAVASMEADPASLRRHWEEVRQASAVRMADLEAPPRWVARASQAHAVAVAKLARLDAGLPVTAGFADDEGGAA